MKSFARISGVSREWSVARISAALAVVVLGLSWASAAGSYYAHLHREAWDGSADAAAVLPIVSDYTWGLWDESVYQLVKNAIVQLPNFPHVIRHACIERPWLAWMFLAGEAAVFGFWLIARRVQHQLRQPGRR